MPKPIYAQKVQIPHNEIKAYNDCLIRFWYQHRKIGAISRQSFYYCQKILIEALRGGLNLTVTQRTYQTLELARNAVEAH
jgi:hypothetical protein